MNDCLIVCLTFSRHRVRIASSRPSLCIQPRIVAVALIREDSGLVTSQPLHLTFSNECQTPHLCLCRPLSLLITHSPIHSLPSRVRVAVCLLPVPFLADICFNVRHIIDEDSPLNRPDWRLKVHAIHWSILGHDVYLGETVCAAKCYRPSQIIDGGVFADATTSWNDEKIGFSVLFDFPKLNVLRQAGQPIAHDQARSSQAQMNSLHFPPVAHLRSI